MKKGFLSHQLCCGRTLHSKYVLFLTSDNRFDSVVPFQQEVPMTVFCEGLLLVVSPAFDKFSVSFTDTLSKQLENDKDLTVGDAVISNPVYLSCMVTEEEYCSVYSIMPVDWSTCRLCDNKIILVKIL